MSVTFFIALVVALLAIVYWRIVLMIVAAILIAMIATGISTVSGALAGSHEHQTIIAPGSPAGEPQIDRGVTSNGCGRTRTSWPQASQSICRHAFRPRLSDNP